MILDWKNDFILFHTHVESPLQMEFMMAILLTQFIRNENIIVTIEPNKGRRIRLFVMNGKCKVVFGLFIDRQ